jgi:hypothetical protein
MSSYPETACINKSPDRLQQSSVMEQLRQRREKTVQELAEIESTISLFEKHPEFERCLTQLARVGIYR